VIFGLGLGCNALLFVPQVLALWRKKSDVGISLITFGGFRRAAGGGDCAWGLSERSLADFGNGGKFDDVRKRDGADDSLSGEAGESGEMRWVVSHPFRKEREKDGARGILGITQNFLPRNIPAMEAEIKLAMVPANMARTPSLARSVAPLGNQMHRCRRFAFRWSRGWRSRTGKGGDGEGARREYGSLSAQLDIGDDFVERHACAQEVADGAAVVPWNADEPCNRSKEEAENLAERAGNPVHVSQPVRPEQHAVEQGY